MGENSKIEWTDHTFNPWTGCEKVSAGCANCYAESWAKRSNVVQWGKDGTRRRTTPANWREPEKWNSAAAREGMRRRVFCASLADVFEDRAELAPWRVELFQLIDATPWLDWLLLTKRPGNIRTFYLDEFGTLPNVWLGTSVENQEQADVRIPKLLLCEAVVRFLSCEPLLGPVNLSRWMQAFEISRDEYGMDLGSASGGSQIDWVIVGGESGPKARACRVAWIESIREQCRETDVACFIKQLGAKPIVCDAETNNMNFQPEFNDKKGGDWDEWPEDLRVREFPVVAR